MIALPLAKPVDHVPTGSLSKLRRDAAECRACPLWKPATQTVFGDGPACRPWLAAELTRLPPRWVIALGAMAAQTLFGNNFRLTRLRGQWQVIGQTQCMASWHPSAILRMTGSSKTQAHAELLADLRDLAARVLSGP